LLSALNLKLDWDNDVLYSYLDLLAISIGADIVPITGENRILCQFGLEQLNKSPRTGIKRLLALAQKPFPIRLVDVVFVIAPRINAAGRMDDAKEAVKLLLAEDTETANELANTIHAANEERRAVDETITEEALALLKNETSHPKKCTNFVYKKGWHKGVIGIVASRIIETHYRPTVILTQPDEKPILTGSVRSIKGINVYDVLEQCSDLLEQFGGHYYAAGLSVHSNNVQAFEQRFDEIVRSLIDDETLIPEQVLERTIDFDELFEVGESLYTVPRFMRILNQFEPHGPGNMKPVFLAENVFAKDVRLLKEKHVKFTLFQPDNRPQLNAILFGRPDAYTLATSGQPLNIVFTLDVNEWQGKSSLQLMVKDVRPALVTAGG
jgi:single-stranded-DNA-specific exonuclease